MSAKKCEGMNPHTPKWTSILGSWWTPKILESDFRSQNPLNRDVLYIIGKLLEHRCLRWACMTRLDISNTSYGQKKGRESNWQFDFRPLKVKNRLNFLACRWRATYRWKALNKGCNFVWDFISIKSLDTKLWAPKVGGVSTLRILGVGVSGQNAIWVLVPWLRIEYIIRGKVLVSPKSRLWWVLWIRVCLWFVLAPKVFKLCINQFVVWFVQVHVSI
jgi:hypothetical protein